MRMRRIFILPLAMTALILPNRFAACWRDQGVQCSAPGFRALDREYLFARTGVSPARPGGSSEQLRCTAIVCGRHPDIGREEAREGTLRGKAEVEADVGHRLFRLHQHVDRAFHQQGIQIEIRRHAGLAAEQFVEMRPRQPGFTGNVVELDVGTEPFLNEADRLADPEIGDVFENAAFGRLARTPPALGVAGVDQAAQLAIEFIEPVRGIDHRRGAPDLAVDRRGPVSQRTAEAQARGVAESAGREPFGIDVKNEEQRPLAEVAWFEIVRLPGANGDVGGGGQWAERIADGDAAVRAAEMEDQMPFAVRVDIEGPVQLINRGATEAAMKHGYRPAHMDPPRVFASLSLKLYKPEEHCKSALSRGAVINHPPALVL